MILNTTYSIKLIKLHECDRLTAVACMSRRSTARPRVCRPARAGCSTGLQPVPAQAGAGCRPASPVALAKTAATVRKCAFSPIAGERVGVGG